MFAFFSCSFKYVFSFCNSLTNLRRESRVSASMLIGSPQFFSKSFIIRFHPTSALPSASATLLCSVKLSRTCLQKSAYCPPEESFPQQHYSYLCTAQYLLSGSRQAALPCLNHLSFKFQAINLVLICTKGKSLIKGTVILSFQLAQTPVIFHRLYFIKMTFFDFIYSH